MSIRKQKRQSHHRQPLLPASRRSSFEILEDRTLLAHDVRFYLDYTPDVEATPDPATPKTGAFSQLFDLSYWKSTLHPAGIGVKSPLNGATWTENEKRLKSLLDFNGDTQIDTKDELGDPTKTNRLQRIGAQRAILEGLARLFLPVVKPIINEPTLNTTVRFARDTHAWSRLTASQNNSLNDTFVLYVGSANPFDTTPLDGKDIKTGISKQAFPGSNFEFYGYVWAGEAVKDMLLPARSRLGWTPTNLVNYVAAVSAHEFGHQLGLGHIEEVRTNKKGTLEYVDSSDTKALMSYGWLPWNSNVTFRNAVYGDVVTRDPIFADVHAPQNPVTELSDSLALRDGQKTRALLKESTVPFIVSDGSGRLNDFGFSEPFRPEPSPPVGSAEGFTVESIASRFKDGLDALGSTKLASLAGGLDFGGGSLPMVGADLATILGLGAALQTLLPSIDLSTAHTMDKLNDLLAAKFHIDKILPNVPASGPADFVRVSQTYRLVDLAKTTSLTQTGLAALGDLAGITLGGELTAVANVALHLTIGVDTSGFYILPGLVLDAPIEVFGRLTTTVGGAGTASGDATLDLRAKVSLNPGADGRIRIDTLDAARSSAVDGVAGLNLTFKITPPAGRRIDFDGNWIWDINTSGFTPDASASGFDDESFFEAISELVGDGIDTLSQRAGALAGLANGIPFIGNSLADGLKSTISDDFNYDNPDESARDYLQDRGFTWKVIAANEFITDALNGALGAKPYMELEYQKTSSITPFSATASGSQDFGVEGVGATFSLEGAIQASPVLNVAFKFGIDGFGPYFKEGSRIDAKLPAVGDLQGTLAAGKLIDITANASGHFDTGALLTIDNGFGENDEPIHVWPKLKLPTVTTYSGTLFLDGLTLTLANPLASFANIEAIKPIADKFLPAGFQWTAVGSYDLVTQKGIYTVTGHNPFDPDTFKQELFRQLMSQLNIDKLNPLPKSFRDFVTTPIELLKNNSILELVGLGEAAVLVNPEQFLAGTTNDVPQKPGEIELHYDFLSPTAIMDFLGGRRADIFSLTINKQFDKPLGPIPIYPVTVLSSYFGVVNVTSDADVVPTLRFGVNITTGIDTDGFYVRRQSAPVLTAEGEIKVELNLDLLLTVIPVARVTGSPTIIAAGGIQFASSAGDPHVRASELTKTDSYNAILTLKLGGSIEGKVGIVDTKLEEAATKDFGNETLYDKTVSITDLAAKFEQFNSDLETKANKIKCELENFWVPGGAYYCELAYDEKYEEYRQKWRDYSNPRIDTAKKKAVEYADDLQAKGQSWIDKTLAGGAEFDAKVIQPVLKFGKHLLDVIPVGPKNNLGGILDSIVNNLSHDCETDGDPETIEERYSFDAPDPVGGVLKVRAHQDAAANLIVSVIDGQVVIDGPDITVDNVLVQRMKQTVRGKINGADCSDITQTLTFSNAKAFAGITRIEIEGTDCDDELVVRLPRDGEDQSRVQDITIPVKLVGKGGRDLLIGGNGSDELDGGDGEDTLVGNGGDDTLIGGDKADILQGGLGDDTLRGDKGDDFLDEVAAPAGQNRSTEHNVLEGGDGDDQLGGSPGHDDMFGGQGKDTLLGNDGADVIYGGLETEPNTWNPDDEGDNLNGGAGDDKLYGGQGIDTLIGDRGNDRLYGGQQDDILFGDDNTDTNIIGDDWLYGEGGDDLLQGGPQDDRLFGGPGADNLSGDGGNDLLIGASEGDEEQLSDGNDVLFGGPGKDILRGGRSGPGLPVFVIPGSDGTGKEFDILDGGADADTLDGQSGPDFISGGTGNDVMYGGDGNDRLVGVEGADELYGGPGDDLLMGSSESGSNRGSKMLGDTDNDVIIGHDGDDTIDGGSGRDNITPGAGENTAAGGDDNDEFFTGAGHDTLQGQLGDDTFVIVNPAGSINAPTGGISIDGGGQPKDNLVIDSGGGPTFTQRYLLGTLESTATLITTDSALTQTIALAHLGFVYDALPVSRTSVFGTNSADHFQLSNGGPITNINTGEVRSLDTYKVASGTFAPIYVVNKPQLTVDGMPGDDTLEILATQKSMETLALGGDGNDLIDVASTQISDNGNLDSIEGILTLAGGADFDKIYINDRGKVDRANYLVTPNLVADLPANTLDSAADATAPRTLFAGIAYDETVEQLRLDGTDLVNVFDVKPSLNTEYFVDGNLPAPGTVIAKYGDFLKLDTKTTFPADSQGLDTSGRKLSITSRGNGYWDFTKASNKRVEFASIERFNHVDIVAAGADAGRYSKPDVVVYDAETNDIRFALPAQATYGTEYRDGIRVATGDLDNDGLPDVVTAPGRLMAPTIKVFNGAPLVGLADGDRELASLQIPASKTYGASFINGVQVAVGDVVGDGLNDIIVVPSRGPSLVKVFENQFLPSSGAGLSAGTIGLKSNGFSIADVSKNPSASDSGWQNVDFPEDINGDGRVTARDALLIINKLMGPDAATGTTLLLDHPSGEYWYDATGDRRITPHDALVVINYILTDHHSAIDTAQPAAALSIASLNAESQWASTDAVRSFNAFPDYPSFIGGATLATADLNGASDGSDKQQIIVASGSGMPGLLRVFDVETSQINYAPVRQIKDPDTEFRGGLNVAIGDVNGDKIADIITGAGNSGNGWVKIYDGKLSGSSTPLETFQAFTDISKSAPTRVVARDINGDGRTEIFTAQGADGRNSFQMKRFKALTGQMVDTYFASQSDFYGGGMFLG